MLKRILVLFMLLMLVNACVFGINDGTIKIDGGLIIKGGETYQIEVLEDTKLYENVDAYYELMKYDFFTDEFIKYSKSNGGYRPVSKNDRLIISVIDGTYEILDSNEWEKLRVKKLNRKAFLSKEVSTGESITFTNYADDSKHVNINILDNSSVKRVITDSKGNIEEKTTESAAGIRYWFPLSSGEQVRITVETGKILAFVDYEAFTKNYIAGEDIVIIEDEETNSGENVFLDGQPSSWAKATIEDLLALNIVPVEELTGFQANSNRLHFAELMVRTYEYLVGRSIEVDESISFTDTDSIFAKKAASVGISNGVGNGLFAPEKLVTREQMVTMLMRTLDLAEATYTKEANFVFADDHEISSWAKDAIYAATASGLIKGVGNNIFSPKSTLSREVAFMIPMRIISMYKTMLAGNDKEDAVSDDENKDSLAYETFNGYIVYRIINVASGLELNTSCLTGQAANGTNINMHKEIHSGDHYFKLVKSDNEAYMIRSLSNDSELYLNIAEEATSQVPSGSNVHVWTDTGSRLSNFKFQKMSNGNYKILFSGDTDLVLSATDTIIGSNVVVETDQNALRQQWQLEQVHINTRRGSYRVVKEQAAVHTDKYGEAEITTRLEAGAMVNITSLEVNEYGNLWGMTEENKWIWMNYLDYVGPIPGEFILNEELITVLQDTTYNNYPLDNEGYPTYSDAEVLPYNAYKAQCFLLSYANLYSQNLGQRITTKDIYKMNIEISGEANRIKIFNHDLLAQSYGVKQREIGLKGYTDVEKFKNKLIEVLTENPEGMLLAFDYGGGNHAIYLTYYKGEFLAVDSLNTQRGFIKLEETQTFSPKKWNRFNGYRGWEGMMKYALNARVLD